MAKKLTIEDMKKVATNLRQMCSDPVLKVRFSSQLRKEMNETATSILVCLRGDLDRSADRETLDALGADDC